MILQTKLQLSPLRARSVRRPRLAQRIESGLQGRLVLVVGPAGYGKSTLLAEWAAVTERPVAVVQLDADDNDPATLITYIAAALQGLDPRVGTALPVGDADPLQSLHALINDAALYLDREIVLALDDYHEIRLGAVHTLMDVLLVRMPPQIRFLLASRTEPLLNLGRLRAAGGVTEIGPEELRFNQAEIACFLNQTMELSLPPDEVSRLERLTEGWPAGLQLAALAPAAPTGGRRVFAYLAGEVLDRQPPPVQSFLVDSAVLARLEPRTCDAVLQRTDSAAMLEYLATRHLFTIPLDPGGTVFRYHALFREFLTARADPSHRAELHRRAGLVHTLAGQPESAIEHYLSGGDARAAAALIEETAGDVLLLGRTHTVQEWLSRLPGEYLQATGIVLVRATLARMQGHVEEAWRLLAPLNASDPLTRSRVLYERAIVVRSRGNYREGALLCAEAAALLPADRWRERAMIFTEQAACWTFAGELAAAEDSSAQALYASEVLGDRRLTAAAAVHLSEAAYVLGNYPRALAMWGRAVELCQELEAPQLPYYLGHNSVAAIHRDQGQLAAAEAFARENLRLKEAAGLRELVPYARLQLGNVLADQWRWDEAEATYRQAISELEALGGEQFYHTVGKVLLCSLLAMKGEAARAIPFGRAMLAERGAAGSRYELGLAHLGLGAACLAGGEYGAAAESLGRAAQDLRATGARYPLVAALSGLARLALGRGDHAAVGRLLDEALGLAEQSGLCQYFWSRPAVALPLLRFAVEHGIHPEFAERLLAGLTEPAGAPGAAAGGLAGPAAVSVGPRRETGTVQVLTLGPLRILVGGEEITGWRTAKARDLLAYLVTSREGPSPRDQILEALWPEVDPPQANALFHTNLYQLRLALRRDGDERKFVLAGGGTYRLDLAAFALDVADFEAARRRHAARRAGGAALDRHGLAELRQATELYRGEYLADLYYDWCLPERERLRGAFVSMMESLLQGLLAAGAADMAVSEGQRLLAVEPLGEGGVRLLMQAHLALGDRPSAVRVFNRLRERLWDEMGVAPAPETQSLYASIRQG